MGKYYKCLVNCKYFKDVTLTGEKEALRSLWFISLFVSICGVLSALLLDMFDYKSHCFNFTSDVNLSVKGHSVSQLSDECLV